MVDTQNNPRGEALDVFVESNRVSCDGGTSGHPKVYYDLNEDGEAWCFYCSRHFIRQSAKAD